MMVRWPGANFRLGTADDGTASPTVGPQSSGANVRGAASYLLLKSDGTTRTLLLLSR